MNGSRRRDLGEGKITRNQAMESSANEKAWKTAYNASRAAQKGRTGIYNPKSGEREYPPMHRGVQKDMQGRVYGRSLERSASQIRKRRG
jgi:hypothetical protein